MPLSPVQRIAIKYLAAGQSCAQVGVALKLPPNNVRRWRDVDPEFGTELKAAILHHGELVEAMLIEGERKAAETLINALGAESSPGRPNWTARVTAAVNLLDRAGGRGKAVDRQQVAVATVKSPEATEDMLRKALRDPGVRAWLTTTGAVQMMLPSAEVEVEVQVYDGFDESDPPRAEPDGEAGAA